MSKDQLNQKFKLMVEAPQIDLYSITPPHVRALWAWSVDATQVSLIPGAKYSIEKGEVNEIRTRDLFVTLALDTMSKDQLNQKFKPMVEAPRIDLYSISLHTSWSWISQFVVCNSICKYWSSEIYGNMR